MITKSIKEQLIQLLDKQEDFSFEAKAGLLINFLIELGEFDYFESKYDTFVFRLTYQNTNWVIFAFNDEKDELDKDYLKDKFYFEICTY